MAFRKVSYPIPACDGCALAWSFLDPACADGIPPRFADRGAVLEQLPRDYGWQVRSFPFGCPLMACRTCAAAGIIPAGPVRQPLPPRPGRGHPESLAAELLPEDEELLAAIEDENFPEPVQENRA